MDFKNYFEHPDKADSVEIEELKRILGPERFQKKTFRSLGQVTADEFKVWARKVWIERDWGSANRPSLPSANHSGPSLQPPSASTAKSPASPISVASDSLSTESSLIR